MFGSRSVQFNPQLEELGVRITPSIKGGSTGDFGHVAVVADISSPAVSGSNSEVAHGIWVGGVDPYSIKAGTGDF